MDNNFSHWKVAFPNQPINNTLINRLPEGWEDSSYHHDDSPSILWKVGKMDCCQLHFGSKVLSLYDFVDDAWHSYNPNVEGEIINLKLLSEWLLLRLRAFEYLTSIKLKKVSEDSVELAIGKYCNNYLKDKGLGSVPDQYWPAEIIGEIQIKLGLVEK